jgi:signal transduction histidine kinase
VDSSQQTSGNQLNSPLPPTVEAILPEKSVKNLAATRYFELIIIVATSYFVTARLGLSLAFIHANVSPVWPPTGLAVAAVLLLGYRIWPGILLGAFSANLFTPISVATAGGIAIGNTLEALAAGVILQHLDFRPYFDRAKDVFKFVVVIGLCTIISATIGIFSLCLSKAAPWDAFGDLWLTWWLGNTIGGLVVAPLLLTWCSGSRHWLPRKRYVEGVVVLFLLGVASMVTFGGPSPIPIRNYPIARLTIPFLLWASFRLGQRGVTLATMTISVIAVWGIAQGLGPFVGRTPNESFLLLQVFLGSNAITYLFLVAAVEEQRLSGELLRENERVLASKFAITRIIAESPSLAEATPRILKTIGETFRWQVGEMWIVRRDANVLSFLASWHAPNTRFERFEAARKTEQFGPGVGLPGLVWSRSESIWVSDVETDGRFLGVQVARGAGLHSTVAVPILSDEKVLGVMELFSKEIREPDDALLQMFSSIGSQLGQFMERKRAEEEREQLLTREHAARAAAELANQTKDEFLAMVSHELRTPLNAIVGWASMLRSGKLADGQVSQAIEIIDRNARVQAQLIEDILDVARIVSGKLRLDLSPVHLQPVIKAAVDSMQPAADAKNIRLHVRIDSKARPVLGDSARLEQIVWNLVSNSVKFTPPGGEIDVSLTSADSEVQIVVSDTGQGIAPEFLPHVFDRFRQGDTSSTRRQGGLGLGLAIVHQLVELQGGTIEAFSAGEGKGATFTVRFPCTSSGSETSPGQTEDLSEVWRSGQVASSHG